MKFPPFIILEGPDAAGKTTLAHAICHRLNAVVLHGASFGDNDTRDNNDDIMRRAHINLVEIATRNLAMGHPVVCDRLWLSHVVYAQARRTPQMARTDWADLLAYEVQFAASCTALGAFYIFAIDDACIDNVKMHQDPDHPRDMAMMQRLLDGYKSVFGEWSTVRPHPCVRYNYTSDGKDIPAYLESLQAHRGLFSR